MSLREPNEFTRRALLKGIGASSVALMAGRAKAGSGNVSAPEFPGVQEPEGGWVISTNRLTVIVVPKGNEPLIQMAAERLAGHIDRATGSKPRIADINDLGSTPPNASAIELSKGSIPYFRPDGYWITTGHEQGHAVVNIVAPDAVGLKYAGYRLIREMRQRARKLRAPILR
jgi:hypothetical protein